MATIIDQLLITLGLDTKNLEDNSKKAQDTLKQTGSKGAKNLAEIDIAGKKAAEVLVKMKNEALTLTSVLLGGMGIKEFVSHTTQANIQAGNFGKNIGMSANDLRAWRNAAEAAGGSADDIQNALGAMNDALQTYRLQGKFTGPMELFSSLGISARDSKGNLISAGDALMRISNALQSRPFQDQASILQKMGFGAGVTPLLSKGPGDIQASLDAMHKLGDAVEGAYEHSKALNEEWVKFKAGVEGAGIAILDKVNSPLIQALHTLTQVSQAVKQVTEGKPADDALRRRQQNAVRRDSWLWNYLFGPSQKPEAVSGRVTTEGGPPASGGLFSSLEQKYGLPAGLLDSIWSAESGRGKNMLSPKGALGHFQFMPGTAKAYGLTDPSNLGQSADAAARMMRDLLRHYGGNLQSALAGYNWGAGKVDSNGMGRLPRETRAYIAKVMGALPVGASARMGGGGTTVETNINQITINTKATDADGIAREMKGAITRNATLAQANSGVN